MSIGSERLTGNSQIAYPFRDDAPAIAAYPFVKGILVDALVETDASVPVYLYELDISGGVLTFVFKVGDVLLDPLTFTSTELAGCTAFYIMRSQRSGATYAKYVLHRDNMITALADNTGTYTFTHDLPLDPCVLNVLSAGVTQLWCSTAGVRTSTDAYGKPVFTTLPAPVTRELDDRVSLYSGYDVALGREPNALLDITDVTIAAGPGYGLGIVDCDSIDPVTTNKPPLGLHPDDGGNVQIGSAGGCYNFTLASYDKVTGAGMFLVTNDCQSCCTCDDYTSVLAAVSRLVTKYRAAKTTLMSATYDPAGYEDGVTRFNAWVNGKPVARLSINGMKGIAYDGARGAPQYARFVVQIKNIDHKGGVVRVTSLGFRILSAVQPISVDRDITVQVQSRSTKHTYAPDVPVDYVLNPGESMSVTYGMHVVVTDDAQLLNTFNWTVAGAANITSRKGNETLSAMVEIT